MNKDNKADPVLLAALKGQLAYFIGIGNVDSKFLVLA